MRYFKSLEGKEKLIRFNASFIGDKLKKLSEIEGLAIEPTGLSAVGYYNNLEELKTIKKEIEALISALETPLDKALDSDNLKTINNIILKTGTTIEK